MSEAGAVASKLGAGVYAPEIERACLDWGIDTPFQQAAFLAQLYVETAGFRRFIESFNYTADGLRKTFSKARISDAECQRLGRTDKHPADQQALADRLYGGLWGRNKLGNTEPGDGWLYRGRGLAMLTGRDNYDRCGRALNLDLLGHPELLVQARYSAQSAGWYWKAHGCETKTTIDQVSVAWNGGRNALAERRATFTRALALLETP